LAEKLALERAEGRNNKIKRLEDDRELDKVLDKYGLKQERRRFFSKTALQNLAQPARSRERPPTSTVFLESK